MNSRISVAAAMVMLAALGALPGRISAADTVGGKPILSGAPGARIGISKQLIRSGGTPTQPQIKARFVVANYGDQLISNIAIAEDLNAVYGAGNYTNLSAPAQLNGEGSLNYNATFNGNGNTALINPGSSLAPGESVTFEITTRVNTLSDQGLGNGIYQNQVTVTGTDAGSNPVSDVSTDGPNPDPDGNDDPSDNSVVSVIDAVNISTIGAAKTAAVLGNVVTFDLYLEAFGSSNLSALSLTDSLGAVFGEGNYSISSPPAFVVNPGGLSLNSGFDGLVDREILGAGSTLAAGAVAQIQFAVTVSNVSNRGFGLGNYRNQVAISAQLPGGVVVQDQSDSGTDPDPNGDGNPNAAGENDATAFILPIAGITGVAKAASIVGSQVTLDFYLRNYGSGNSNNLSLVDDLDSVFGASNYVVSGAPVFIDDPGTLTLNAGYDGAAQTGLFAPGGSLASGDTAQIRVVINVTTLSNQQGFGFGVYQNQAFATATDLNGLSFTDVSESGSNPDPDNNNDPSTLDEDTPTLINLSASGTGIGVALQAYVSGAQITYDFTIENLSNVAIPTFNNNVSLLSVFGFGNFAMVGPPTLIENPGTINLNPSYDGLFSPTLVNAGSSLGPNARARIRFVVNVTNVTNQGNGFGVYNVQISQSAVDAFGATVNDLSDAGVLTDSNGNGNAGDVGENDITVSIIGEEPVLGAALQAALVGNVVTYDAYLENLGNVSLSSLSVIDDLDRVFGAGNYTVSSPPVLIDDPGTLTVNAGFDGSTDRDLLSAGTLAVGDTAQLRFGVTINNPADVGLGYGVYANRLAARGLGPSGTVAADLSDDGIDPDSNGNNNPADAGEFDPSIVNFGFAAIGAAKQAMVSGGAVTLDFVIENFGTTALTQVSLLDDLDAVFGAGNYQILGGPTLTSPPRNLAVNPAFNGSTITQLIGSGSSIDPLGVERIRLLVQVNTPIDQGSGLGVYANQVSASSAEAVSDLSDSGNDPDPNGNGDPSEAGEDDPTLFTVQVADVAISISDGSTTAVPGSTITYTTTAINNGGQTASGVLVSSNFAAILSACSSTSMAAGGASGNDPGPFAGNLSDSGISLPVGGTVTYTTVCAIPATATGSVLSSVAISTDLLDSNPANNSASDTSTLTPQADLLISKDDGQTSAIPGAVLTYTIVVSNAGPSSVSGATVADVFPADLSGVSYSASSSNGATGFTAVGSGNINDTVNLPPGSSITYVASATLSPAATTSLFNTATVTAPAGVSDPLPGNNSATDSDSIDRQADLAITKTDGAATAVAGAPISYTIVVSNAGPGAALNAVVNDSFATTLTACSWTCVGAGGGSCTATGSGNIVDTVNLPVSATASYTASCTVAPTASGTLINTATVAAAAGTTDPATANNSAADTNTLTSAADLLTTLTDAPDPILAGGTLSYVATLANAGPSAAQDVTLALPLPVATTLISVSPSVGGVCSAPAAGANGTVSCTWAGATVPGAAGNRSINIAALVDAATADGTVLSATATASSLTTDPTAGNDSATTTTTVSSTADLAMTLSATPDPVTAGSNLSYLATATNNGPVDAQMLTISLPLATGTSFVLATPSAGGNCNAVSPVICSWVGATTPAATRSVTVVALVAPAQTAALSATATVSAASVDPVPGNDSATVSTAVANPADLAITLTDTPDPVVAGTQLTYMAEVSNAGPFDASGVTITLPLPTDTSLLTGSVTGGGTCTGAPVVCVLSGSIAAGTSRTATIVLAVAPSVLSGTMINASATVAAASPDPNVGNDVASAAAEVITSADLVLGFSASTTQIALNAPVTFTATSLNQGPSDAQDVVLTIATAPGLRYTSHSAVGATCSNPAVGTAGNVVCTWAGATAPALVRTLQVVASGNVASSSAVNASTASNTPDPVANNDLGSVTVQVGFIVEQIPALSWPGLLLLGTLLGVAGFVVTRRLG